jgi:glutamate-ammonia-ligase adenylyltransferase
VTSVLSPEVLGRTLAQAPDPELARVQLSRVGEHPAAREALARPEVLPYALMLLGFSRAAADFFSAHPTELEALADVRPRPRHELDAELSAAVEEWGLRAGLRRFRHRAMFRVAARDLAGAPFEEVVAEITAVAEACLSAAVGDAALALVGMGKLGGEELNYASDVDVIFVHADAGPDAARRAEGEASSAIRSLADMTPEGIALRIDATLRPGGRGGALSRSLAATADYYARHAATWERQALIKARPVAGDVDLGARLLEAVAPFVYSDLQERAIDEMRRNKVRIEEYVRARGKEAVEVKRGRGGIRDVEFAVQLLQLVHGRRDGRLREPNTVRALSVLAAEGYVAEEDARVLADAYRFLRTLEHRLQMVRDLQTHELPADTPARTSLARSMGFASAQDLQGAYERQTELVRGLHHRLFYRPLLEAFAGRAASRPGVDRPATEELLSGLGFRNEAAAYGVLDRLVDPGTRTGKVLAHVFPVMAPALALSADPDAALLRLERVVAGLRDRPEVADAMASDPVMARRLAHLAAASSFAVDIVAARPEVARALGGGAPADDHQAALLSVVAGYASREFDPKRTGAALARVADAVVTQALERARPGVPVAVIGLGKLGAEELNFASDLDVVFVYEGQGTGPFEEAVRAGERVLAGVRQAGWEPDPDLRPEGRNGPLARSIAAFLEYWERWAEPWEFQSLLRARFVAGDEGLVRRFVSLASDFAYPEDLPPSWVTAIRRMRVRIERERVRPPDARRFAFKLGYGSLADVQFAVELALMRHGGSDPAVRSRRTLEAIERLAEARAIEDSVARALGEAFTFLSDVKNALEVDRRMHAEVLPASPEEQASLARRLGYEEYPRQSFLEEYRRITRRARSAMERVFYGEEADG